MTLDRARELLAVQCSFGGGYNANSAKLILSEVQKAHGLAAADALIREMGLDKLFGINPGSRFMAGITVGDCDNT